MTTFVISPHLDDAVLSLGRTIAQLVQDGEPVTVITVLAGVPDMPNQVTDYDKSTGFSSSREAMEVRRDEDLDALDFLGADGVHLWFLDQQYNGGESFGSKAPIVQALRETCFSSGERVLAPLGIGHRDHRLVAECARLACPDLFEGDRMGMWVYEELPYRVLWPEQVFDAFEELRVDGWWRASEVAPFAQAGNDMKEAAISYYRSQYPDGGSDQHEVLVPERCWSIMKESVRGSI